MTPRDWTLLTIAAGRGRPLTPVQLQKSLFLLGKKGVPELKAEDLYAFAPYDYGPFCADIYADADALAASGDVLLLRSANSRLRLYGVTPQGEARAEELKRGLSGRLTQYLEALVTWVQSLSFNQLVSAIYREFPEMRQNSVFRG